MIKKPCKEKRIVITEVYRGISDCRSIEDLARLVNTLNALAHEKGEEPFRVVGGPLVTRHSGGYGVLLVRRGKLDLDE
jgi:hypothetical protein